MVEFDGFKQGLEVAFAEAFVALALNEFKEDGANSLLREDLQKQALPLSRRAVDQDFPLPELFDVVAVAGQALVDQVEIGIDGVLKGDAAGIEPVHGGEQIIRTHRNVLDASPLYLIKNSWI